MKQLLSLALMLTLCLGCGTTGQRTAYTTLKASADSVDTALKAYASLVVRDQVNTNTQARVVILKRDYERAMDAAIAVAQYDWTKPTPPEVGALVGQITQLIADLTAKAPKAPKATQPQTPPTPPTP